MEFKVLITLGERVNLNGKSENNPIFDGMIWIGI